MGREKEIRSMKRPLLFGLALASLGSIGLSLQSREAWAQSTEATVSTTPTAVDTTTYSTGPSMEMVGSGIGTFALSYLPAVVVGATSDLDADRTLFVPLAGPWLDLTQRPKCGPIVSCNTEDTDKVLLVTDGVFQAIGAISIVGGFLTTTRETRTVRAADMRPTLRISPASVGGKGYGLMALGSF
jgi:hypothetical protein